MKSYLCKKIAFLMDNRPIGVFDSGLGGISVLNHLAELLPNEQFLYLADSLWCPYGNKSYKDLQDRASKIVDFFLTQNVKMIVVACNTATAAAIEFLRGKYEIPFVGMEPAIKPAAKLTRAGAVGVLATENTFNGELFRETKQKYASQINVIIQKGCGLVELVENNQTTGEEAFALIKKYTKPMVAANADYLVLGCTHYPFLMQTIRKVAPSLKIIDPALPVARRVNDLLNDFNQNANHKDQPIQLYTTGEIKKLKDFANTFMLVRWEAKHISI